MDTSPLVMRQTLAPEDQARAEFYALLGRLYTTPPDAPLLALVGASELWSEADGNPLAGAWNRLVLASQAMEAEAAEQEYNELFIGVGKSEIDLHASHWLPGHVMEKPLADLRTELATLGLARQPGVTTYEDNLGALCETMRILIAGHGTRRPEPVATQRAFFERRIAPWAFDCCDAICNSSVANYYRRVAEFTLTYLAVERDSLAID
jgi:TorA maturation chaperone TorD